MVTSRDLILAIRLRQLRHKLDLKQTEAYELLGFKYQQDYSRLENGQKHFTPEIIEMIVCKFKISYDEFTGAKEVEVGGSLLNHSAAVIGDKSELIDIIELCNIIHTVRQNLELSKQMIKIAELKQELEALKNILMFVLESIQTKS